MMNKESYLHVV